MLHFLMTSLMTLNKHKNRNYVIIASLNRETIGKLINRIPGSHLLISTLQGSTLRRHDESPGKPYKACFKRVFPAAEIS